jgi:dTDP-4-dehydrorhamnose 3,5-epimerase
MPFRFERLAIPEVILVEPEAFSDARGFFMETYKATDFAPFVDGSFVQENHSKSQRGTLRGLHFQVGPYAQGKLVRAVAGEIFDVAVDVRPDSQTRGRWVGAVLSADNRRMLYVPPWCAHGFCVLSETAEVVYKTTTEYAPAHESGVMWNDPALAIEWPVESPVVSERDTKWPPFLPASMAVDGKSGAHHG